MPPREHPLDFVEHPLPDSSRFAFALDDGLDISFEVSPAELPTAVRPPGIGAVSVGHEDAHRPVVAQPAVERVLLVLRDDRLDGRQFEHLMSMRFGVSTVKEPGTFIALLRDTGNDFVDLFRRHQDTLVPLVPWLSPWLASRRRLLRSRLHPGTIAGGRLR